MSFCYTLRQKLNRLFTVHGQGVEATIKGIHRIPDLCDWITIESVALPPLPVNHHGQWRLFTLLAVPRLLTDGTEGYRAPWGAIEWSWPERRIVNKINLDEQQEISLIREQQKFIRKYSSQLLALHAPATHAHLESVLLRKIDALFALPPCSYPKLDHLSHYYSELLPEELYVYYWTLLPSSREWLQQKVYQEDNLSSPEERSDLAVPDALHTSRPTPPLLLELQAHQGD